jgi:orotidine-5'-phosphate decarboxylase
LTRFFNFAWQIVQATAESACIFKPNLGFWAANGAEDELADLIEWIHSEHGLPVILDAKYGDIGNTAKQYARAAFERFGADAVTINPYLGPDTLQPWLEWGPEHAIIVLAHTSNPGAAKFQERILAPGPDEALQPGGRELFIEVAKESTAVETCESAKVGLVMGATFPEQLVKLTGSIPPIAPLLIPGIGKQEGALKETVDNAKVHPFVINSSRGIIHASQKADFAEVAAAKAQELRDQINLALAA